MKERKPRVFSRAVLATLVGGLALAAGCSGQRPAPGDANAVVGASARPPGTPGSPPPLATTVPSGGGGRPQTCTSSPSGSLGPYGYPGIVNSNGFNAYVANNMWGANRGTTQTVCASDPGHWTLAANAGPPGYTGVQTYPDVQQLFNDWTGSGWNGSGAATDTPLSALKSLTSSYAISNPPTSSGDWEAAYDIWLSNSPNSEIMIWVYTSDARGTGGATIENPHVVIGGQNYRDQNYGGGLPQMVLTTNQASGTIDILAVLKYLQSQGEVSATATLGQLDFGWEICSTVGTENFAVTSYTLNGS